jgi:hypothetical protein
MSASVEKLLLQAVHAEEAYLAELHRDEAILGMFPGLVAASEARIELFNALAEERRLHHETFGEAPVDKMMARSIAHNIRYAEEARERQYSEADARQLATRFAASLELGPHVIEDAIAEWKAMVGR